MAVNVRVTGPELLSEENRRAFLRIEEAVRQYSAHTRGSIYLLRRPLDHPTDHFVLLWPQGIALAEMIPAGGTIQGSQSGYWYSENAAQEESIAHSSSVRLKEPTAVSVPNPYRTLLELRNNLSSNLQSEALAISDPAAGIAMIALFTAAQHLRIEPIHDPLFSALTIEDAVARSIMHRPNLLRASEIEGSSYSTEQLEQVFSALESKAEELERTKSARTASEPEVPTAIPGAPRERRTHSPYWLVLVLLALAGFTYVMIRVVTIRTSPSATTSTTKVVSHTPSEIVIETPLETELFISPFQFQSRAQLDRALTYGEGLRFLPDTEQVVVMDSLTLAKGVYGYFRVQESWRKGMLLQTLSHSDTIDIVKFLDPLP